MTQALSHRLLGALALAGALLAAPAADAAAKLKVGFIYVGPVGDFGWSWTHDQGRLAIEAAMSDKVETTFVESVPEGADAERVLTQLAKDGAKLIFTTSFGYMNPTLKVAKAFPNVKFEHATGYKRAANLSTYSGRFYEGRTILGTIAGKMSKSGIIGYVASVPIPEVVGGIDAFTIALRKINPKATVKVIYVNEWYNPGKEAAAAKALIDQGADVIAQHTDSPAPVQAAEERGVYAFGQDSDMIKFGPKAHLTAIVDNWTHYYTEEAKAVLDGTWKSHDVWGGLDSGMVEMAPYNPNMPKDVAALADQVKADIIAHTLLPFAGPIKDQSGKEIVPAGKNLSDGEILGINYYVEGVEGTIPK